MSVKCCIAILPVLVGCQLTVTADNDPADAAVVTLDAETLVDAALGAPDGSVPLACAGFDGLFCDGFESGSLADWELDQQGGTVELVSAPVFRGQGAVRMRTQAAGAVAQIHRAHPAQTSGTVYTRFYMYLPANLITDGPSELTNSGDGGGIHYHFGVNRSTPFLLVNDIGEQAPAELPRDAWVCIEMALEIAANGGGELFINGAAVAGVDNTDTRVPGGYDRAFFGMHFTADVAGALDFYFDEIASGTDPIGCLP